MFSALSDGADHPREDETVQGVDAIPVQQARQTQRVEHGTLVNGRAVLRDQQWYTFSISISLIA